MRAVIRLIEPIELLLIIVIIVIIDYCRHAVDRSLVRSYPDQQSTVRPLRSAGFANGAGIRPVGRASASDRGQYRIRGLRRYRQLIQRAAHP